MAERSWMPMYWGDYLRDTMHLSHSESGAYLALIAAYWINGKPLPDDDKQLARIIKCSRFQWLALRFSIQAFFTITDGVWIHKRVEKELLRSSRRSAVASANARSSRARAPLPQPQSKTPSESIRKARTSTEPPVGGECTIQPEDSIDLDAVFFRKGKALLGPKSGGMLSKLRATVGLGQALQIIDDAQRKDSPAEYIGACVRNKGNGYGRRPSAVQELSREYLEQPAASAGEGNDQSIVALRPPPGGRR